MANNSDELECSRLIQGAQVSIHGHQFTIDFYIIPILGIDLVLGVQRLELLGPCMIDYKILTMEIK